MALEDEEGQVRSIALENAQRVERELADERERLRITLASIGDAVISTDAEGRVTFLNGVAEALTGWPQAEAAGRPLPEVFHIVNEQTRRPVENPALRALREGAIVGLANHTVLDRPGRDRAAHRRQRRAHPGRARAPRSGAVLVFRDVTERKRAEEAQARLAAIVESSEDAIVSKTLDGVIRSWNAGAERLFGYTAEEAVGRPITLIIPPERLDEERDDPGPAPPRRAGRALRDRARRQGRPAARHLAHRLPDPGRRRAASSGRRRSPATSPTGSGRSGAAGERRAARVHGAARPRPRQSLARRRRGRWRRPPGLLAEHLRRQRLRLRRGRGRGDLRHHRRLHARRAQHRGALAGGGVRRRVRAADAGQRALRHRRRRRRLARRPPTSRRTATEHPGGRSACRFTRTAASPPRWRCTRSGRATGRRWRSSWCATVVGRSWESIERTRVTRGLQRGRPIAWRWRSAAASLGDWSWTSRHRPGDAVAARRRDTATFRRART